MRLATAFSLLVLLSARPLYGQGVRLEAPCDSAQGANGSPCSGPLYVVWLPDNPYPAYPPKLRDTGIPGQVQISIRVLRDGSVAQSSVRVRSSTLAVFEAPVLAAASEWRFAPGTGQFPADGIPFTFRVAFRIDSGACEDSKAMARPEWQLAAVPPTLSIPLCVNQVVPRAAVF